MADPARRPGDREVDDRVTEKLEPLVMAGGVVGVLMQPARMDEGLGDEGGIRDRKAQPLRERGGRSHGSRVVTRS